MHVKPKISVVLGSYNRLPFIKLTIKTVRDELRDFLHEIIVVDGGSEDGTMEWLAQQKDIVTIIQHNRGEFNGRPIERRSWGYFMNLGFKSAQGKYICMISDDCLVVPGAIRNGYELFERELEQGAKIGAMAFYFRNWKDEETYKVQGVFGDKLCVNHGLYLKQALEEIDYIDEDRYMFYYADRDICLRLLQKGYTTIDAPDSFIEHFKHVDSTTTRKKNILDSKSDAEAFMKRWHGIYHKDNKDNGTEKRKTFHDPHNTVVLYKKVRSVRLYPIKAYIRRLIKKIK